MEVGRDCAGEFSSLPGARSEPASMDARGPRGGPCPKSKLTGRAGSGVVAGARGSSVEDALEPRELMPGVTVADSWGVIVFGVFPLEVGMAEP